jgi:hypothetical protein
VILVQPDTLALSQLAQHQLFPAAVATHVHLEERKQLNQQQPRKEEQSVSLEPIVHNSLTHRKLVMPATIARTLRV